MGIRLSCSSGHENQFVLFLIRVSMVCHIIGAGLGQARLFEFFPNLINSLPNYSRVTPGLLPGWPPPKSKKTGGFLYFGLPAPGLLPGCSLVGASQILARHMILAFFVEGAGPAWNHRRNTFRAWWKHSGSMLAQWIEFEDAFAIPDHSHPKIRRIVVQCACKEVVGQDIRSLCVDAIVCGHASAGWRLCMVPWKLIWVGLFPPRESSIYGFWFTVCGWWWWWTNSNI